VISFHKKNGLYYASSGQGGMQEVAPTLEKLLGILDPGAPPLNIAYAAEIIEQLIGPEKAGQIGTGVMSA
jgi:hypothetical protein